MKVILSLVVFFLFSWISSSVAQFAGLEPHDTTLWCIGGGMLAAMFIYLIIEAKEKEWLGDNKEKDTTDDGNSYLFQDDCYLPAVATAGLDKNKDSDPIDFDGDFAGAGWPGLSGLSSLFSLFSLSGLSGLSGFFSFFGLSGLFSLLSLLCLLSLLGLWQAQSSKWDE